MEEFGEITKNKDVALGTKSKVIHTLMSPIAMDGCESWTAMTTDGDKTD